MTRNRAKLPAIAALAALTVIAIAGCPQTANRLCVVNNSGAEMLALNITPSGSGSAGERPSWGCNQISQPVSPLPGNTGTGNTYCVTQIPNGAYDLRAVFNTSASQLSAEDLEVYQFNIPFGPSSWQWLFTREFIPGTSSYLNVDSLYIE